MGFTEKIKTIVSGKTPTERLQEEAANKIIRQKVMAAQLRERQEQAIKYAVEKEKISYQRKTAQLKQTSQPKKFGFNVASPGYTSYGGLLGAPRLQQQRPANITRPVSSKKRRKGKRSKSRTVYRTAPRQTQQRGFDILGF